MRVLQILTFIFLMCSLRAQSGPPIILSLQFHSLAVPFHHLTANFRNVGIGIGTELNYGNQSDFHQGFSLIWYRNRAVGNGLLLQSQAIWRPSVGNTGFGEIKAGLGYLFSRRPLPSFQYQNGNWVSAGKKGKGMLTVPVGIGGGYTIDKSDYQISPFLGYQVMAISGYNRSIPLVTETLLQFGTRLKTTE